MAEEQDNYRIKFDTNAKEATQDVNGLAKGLDSVENATDNVVKANKSLKAQIKEATIELIKAQEKFGDYSKEALNSAKNLAQLRDRMAEASETANLFDPGKKFQAVAGSISAMASGFAVAQGAMGLFGTQSEEVEKTLLKVQSAMALSQGLSTIADSGKDFQRLKALVVDALKSITAAKLLEATATEAGTVVENQSTLSKVKSTVALGAKSVATTVATGVQWLWNTAIMANPLVAFAVALVAATAGVYALTKMLMESSEANNKASNATKSLEKQLDKESQTLARTGLAVREKNHHTLAMAKANGDSTESIRKLERKLIDEQIATDKASAITARNTFITERNNLAKLKASDASEDVIKAREKEVQAAYKTFQRENKQLDSSYKERAQLKKDQEVQIRQEETNAENKLADDRKQAREKRLAEEKEARKKAADQKIADEKKLAEDLAKEEEARRKEKQNKEIEANKIISEARKANENSLLTENEIKVNAENSAYEEKLLKLIEFNLSTDEIDAEHKRKLEELAEEESEKQGEKDKAILDAAKAKYDEDVASIKIAEEKKQEVRAVAVGNVENIGKQLQVLAGKNKDVARAGLVVEGAVGLAKIVSNTMQANAAATAAFPLTAGMPFVALNTVSGALSAAAQIKAVSTGLKALGGGSAGAAPSFGGAGGASGAAAPSVSFNNTAENQIGQSIARTQADQPPIQVSVLESDITRAQTNVVKLNNTNTI